MDIFPSANYYADGRQALIHLYKTHNWDCLWVPEYFCHDVIETLKNAGLELRFYTDYPENDDSNALEEIQRYGHFHPKDAVLRMNYFGMRSYRSADRLSVAAIIEDHTHDLLGGWAQHSSADWCIASLRKTLPIPEGGILWSPLGHSLPPQPEASEENERIASIRWAAMRLKSRYLSGEDVEKSAFRRGFLDTEPYFDSAPVCSLDKESITFLDSFDVQGWYKKKRDNWAVLCHIRKDGVRVILPEGFGCIPFSLVLLFRFSSERERVRKAMIAHKVYPAVLWSLPFTPDGEVYLFSQGMLSIHCDGRYSPEDIQQLKLIIESVL